MYDKQVISGVRGMGFQDSIAVVLSWDKGQAFRRGLLQRRETFSKRTEGIDRLTVRPSVTTKMRLSSRASSVVLKQRLFGKLRTHRDRAQKIPCKKDSVFL